MKNTKAHCRWPHTVTTIYSSYFAETQPLPLALLVSRGQPILLKNGKMCGKMVKLGLWISNCGWRWATQDRSLLRKHLGTMQQPPDTNQGIEIKIGNICDIPSIVCHHHNYLKLNLQQQPMSHAIWNKSEATEVMPSAPAAVCMWRRVQWRFCRPTGTSNIRSACFVLIFCNQFLK